MKVFISISLFLVCSLNFFGLNTDLEYIRAHYEQAVSDEKLCHEMIQDLEKEETPTNTHLAYLGGLQTIWANHVSNPLSKLNTFKKGKASIEKAIQKDSNNVEIRLIRLSVQKNCPAFLGYSKNITEDEKFIRSNKEKINSLSLLKMIDTVLNK
jgi:hypothetical protein